MRTFLLLFLSYGPASAADALTAPVLGVIREGTEIRKLHGIPGSMDLGERLTVPTGSTLVAVAPRQHWGILQRDNDWSVYDWQHDLIQKIGEPADLVAISASGTNAILFTKENRRIRLLSELPGKPRVSEHSLDLESIEHLAVNDRGDSFAAVSAGRLLLIAPGRAPLELYQSDGIVALAFVPDQNALLVADRLQNSVLRIEPGHSPQPLLTSENGLDVPTSVWAGVAGRVAVVSAKRELLWIYENSAWDFHPVSGLARIEEMQLRDTLLLLDSTGRPLGLHMLGAEQKIYRLPRPTESGEVN